MTPNYGAALLIGTARSCRRRLIFGRLACILAILFALEYFQIVDIPYLDLPDIQTTGEEYKEKSEDNMRRRFGD